MTKLFGVIGDPIAHSLSPLIHRGWMREHNLDAEYLGMQVPAGELLSALETLERRGCKGLNVTLPHKEGAFQMCESTTDRAEKIGAVNTLSRPGDGTWRGDNTDAPGFHLALNRAFDDVDVERHSADSETPALLIGAGGASRAVAYIFGGEAWDTVFCNRTVRRADALTEVYKSSAQPDIAAHKVLVSGLEDVQHHLRESAFVVNATSLGHEGKSLDWPDGRGRLLYDLSYGKAAEAFLAPARAAGWKTVDGLYMLVAQAAFSFEIWFGIKPDIDSALARAKQTLAGVA